MKRIICYYGTSFKKVVLRAGDHMLIPNQQFAALVIDFEICFIVICIKQ